MSSKNSTTKCITKYCRREKKRGPKCCRCYWRELKEKDPIRYTFYYVKNNAKRRLKEWGISIEEFRKFCVESGYMESKGKQRWSMSIDRINNERGYYLDNIRILSLGLNSAKGTKEEIECPF